MKYQCDMIEDLMLLCAEDTASAEGRTAVREHIAECRNCSEKWHRLTGSRKVAAAKRFVLPKKWKIGLTAGAVTAFAVYLAMQTIVPYAKMYYFECGDTPEEAIEHAVQEREWVTGPYDADRILGTYQEDDDSWFCWMLNGGGCGTYYVNPFHGRYYCGGETSRSLPEDLAICGLCEQSLYKDDEAQETLYAFYVRNEAVKTMQMTIGTETQTADCNDKGLCIMVFSKEDRMIPERPERSGTAMDAEGHVLYTLRESDAKNGNTLYTWEAAEE
ncbi:MAG TPA: hypothetical protein DCG49_09330 [Ruminococcus sp.]|nr:hypothetical protein [Ruminococcus sp.]